MKKTYRPGERFNAFQNKKKAYSESDMGSMKGYNPNLGLQPSRVRTSLSKSNVAKSITQSPRYPAKSGSLGGVKNFGGVGGLQGGYGAGQKGHQNVGSTEYKKKHSKKAKHKKNWIANAIKKPGALHAELGVKKGNKIPAKTLAKAAKKGGVEGKRARLAETLKGFHKKEHSAEAIKGVRKFVNEEAKEKVHKKHHKGSMKHCKTCNC